MAQSWIPAQASLLLVWSSPTSCECSSSLHNQTSAFPLLSLLKEVQYLATAYRTPAFWIIFNSRYFFRTVVRHTTFNSRSAQQATRAAHWYFSTNMAEWLCEIEKTTHSLTIRYDTIRMCARTMARGLVYTTIHCIGYLRLEKGW